MNWENTIIRDELAYRILKNYGRLESKNYRPDLIFEVEQNGWAGDWEGRTILALVFHGQVTKREPAYLEQILQKLPERFNQRGYIGKILLNKEIDEQQLAGHSWLLRGLIEYFLWKKDKKVWDIIECIVRHLYIPTKGAYHTYPVQSECRGMNGEASGNIAIKQGVWHLSTDIGCAFICLDALTYYYELTKDKQTEKLIREMIAAFVQIDFVGSSMQTHATLTATRGILKFFEITKEDSYLEEAIRIFEIYEAHGMTENYANFNWFLRPVWTEPCAIVDSYMVSMLLFKHTKKPHYLQTAQRIYYNGIGFAQRYNGGFGCDICTGDNSMVLMPKEEIFEAYWCCSMRGAEGLKAVAEDTVCIENDTIYIYHYHDLETYLDDLHLRIQTEYPRKGKLSLYKEGISTHKRFAVYIPEFAQNSCKCMLNDKKYQVNLENGYLIVPCEQEYMEIIITFDIPIYETRTTNTKTVYKKYFYGDLLLGMPLNKEEGLKIEDMKPINCMIDMENEQLSKAVKLQILFPIESTYDGKDES